MSEVRRIGYRNSRDGFIWPATVLCEAHITQERVDDVVKYMLAMNTTAYPGVLRDSENEPCVACSESPKVEMEMANV